ncbi:MAG: UbiD family decarboxylase [Candidatus Saliniplasma sp.]
MRTLSFSSFVNKFEKRIVEEEVSCEMDATKEALKDLEEPVYFPNFPGGPLMINLWGTRERVGKALDVDKSQIVDLLAQAVENPEPVEIVDDAPILDNMVADFDLRDFPIPKYYPKDGGRYITSGVVFSEYDGDRNLSFHRMMLTGKDTFTIRLVPRHLNEMYEKAKEDGEELKISIAIGLCPSILLAGATSVEYHVDEFEIASALRKKGRGERVQAVKLEDGSLVPAYTEYVFQGRITHELADEGPFVDITGTYDKVRQQPVVKIDKIYHKNDPIFHALLPGGYEHFLLMGLPRESVMKSEVGKITNVKDVRLTEGGCSWLHGVISVNKDSDGEVKEAIKKAFEAHTSMKKVIIVDDDIDIFDDRQVEWAVATRFQPHKDLVILEDQKGSSLDPSAPELTSKWGLDATKPWDGKEFTKAKVE